MSEEWVMEWFISLAPAERLLVFIGFAVSWIAAMEWWIGRRKP